MALEEGQLVEFDHFRVDLVKRQLLRDGQPVQLTSKAFETLAVLIRNRDRVMDKQELLKTIWPDSFVEESNLAQHVSALRKALGDQPGENRYIVTVPGKGYRFVGEVRVPQEPEAEAPAAAAAPEERPRSAMGRRLAICLVAALVLLGLWAGWRWFSGRAGEAEHPRSLAVLPFEMISTADGQDYLGVGLADAVSTRPSNIRELVVRPTSAVLRYGKKGAVVAGRELGVDALLDGKVQNAGGRVRVSVQLIRVSDSRVLWADSFDADETGLFGVEDSVSVKVAQALSIRLAGDESKYLAHHYTENAEAYRNYLQGRFSAYHFTKAGLNQAIEYFQRAIAQDGGYALAYAGLADAYTTSADWVLSPRQALPLAEAAARKALELDQNLSEAHVSLAHALLHEWKMKESEQEFERALQLNPNHTSCYFFYAEYLSAVRRGEDAITEVRKAIALDPQSAQLRGFLVFPEYLKGDYEAALAAARDAIRLDPDFWVGHMGAGFTLLAMGRLEDSLPEFEKARELNPGSTYNLAGMGAAEAGLGRKAEARQMLTTFNEMAQRQYVSPMDVAFLHAALGDRDEAFAWLDKAYEDQSEMLLFLKIFYPVASLQTDPRFAALAKRVGVQ